MKYPGNVLYKQNSSRTLSGTLGTHGIKSKQEIKLENEKENKISNDLKLEYDNNGSELFFSTMNNEIPWGVKIYKLIETSCVSYYDIIKYRRNDNIVENFLKNNRYFKYEFFLNNDFLIDFVRKRRNGMTSVHHEILFYDNHRSMFNYYNKLGVKYLGNLGFQYSGETSENNYDKTIYHVKFYNTEILEKVTLTNIVQEKTIKQLLLESDEIIQEICKQEKMDFNIKRRHSIYIILQKYKYYFNYLENNNETTNIQKIRFLKNTLKADNKLNEDNLNHYLSKIQDEYLLYVVNDILNSLDMEERYELLINDINNLSTLINKTDVFAEIKFIENSNFYNENETINNILNKIKNYDSYKNIKQRENERELFEEYKNITKIELVNKASGNNYASCDGIYVIDKSKLVNKQPIFINEGKQRFIANSNGSWILTANQYLDAIIEESKDKTTHYFGGFHASTTSDAPIALSKWKEYDIDIKR